MVKNENEAKEELERLKSIINEAIAKGEAPAPREKVKVNLMEIYKHLPPQTNCADVASRDVTALPSSLWPDRQLWNCVHPPLKSRNTQIIRSILRFWLITSKLLIK